MVNFGLAREIYGLEPWHMDPMSLIPLSATLEMLQKGVRFESEFKCNTIHVLNASNKVQIIYEEYQLNTEDNFKGIGVINLNGPITKNGGASSYGMDYLSQKMINLSIDKRIVSILILADSGGGSSSAVEIMTDAILEVQEKKPVYALITKGGMAASACYGIISACNAIYAESQMSIVGSCGTMVQFEGIKANTTDSNGLKHIRLYAPKSTKKNIEFEEALNNDNYQLIIDNILNPINERFTGSILKNRPQLSNTSFDDGHTVFAKDAIGTFIDAIKTFDEVVQIASTGQTNISKNVEFTKSDTIQQLTTSSKPLKNYVMTVENLKTFHPELYNEVFNLGVEAGKARIKSWMDAPLNNIWEKWDGINSGLSYSEANEKALKNFYNSVDERLDSKLPGLSNSENPEQKEDYYTMLEAQEFYAEVDRKFKG